MEALLYATCQKLGITYVTICHRPALRVWHTHNLNLLGDGKGGFTFAPLEHTDAEKEIMVEHARDCRSVATVGDVSSYAAALTARSTEYVRSLSFLSLSFVPFGLRNNYREYESECIQYLYFVGTQPLWLTRSGANPCSLCRVVRG